MSKFNNHLMGYPEGRKWVHMSNSMWAKKKFFMNPVKWRATKQYSEASLRRQFGPGFSSVRLSTR